MDRFFRFIDSNPGFGVMAVYIGGWIVGIFAVGTIKAVEIQPATLWVLALLGAVVWTAMFAVVSHAIDLMDDNDRLRALLRMHGVSVADMYEKEDRE